MVEEINFLELACLLKVTPNTVLEKFGSAINSSIFDASNIAGSLKQNNLIDFTAYYPGPNEIVVTETGKKLIAEADAKSTEPFDKLDEAILGQLSGGKRVPLDLQNTLNLRPKDLALRLYKLGKQGYIIYELKSGGVDLLLTENGFLKANAGQPASRPQQKEAVTAAAQPQQHKPQQAKPAAPSVTDEQNMQMENNVQDVMERIKADRKKGSRNVVIAGVALIVILVIIYFLYAKGTI